MISGRQSTDDYWTKSICDDARCFTNLKSWYSRQRWLFSSQKGHIQCYSTKRFKSWMMMMQKGEKNRSWLQPLMQIQKLCKFVRLFCVIIFLSLKLMQKLFNFLYFISDIIPHLWPVHQNICQWHLIICRKIVLCDWRYGWAINQLGNKPSQHFNS